MRKEKKKEWYEDKFATRRSMDELNSHDRRSTQYYHQENWKAKNYDNTS